MLHAHRNVSTTLLPSVVMMLSELRISARVTLRSTVFSLPKSSTQSTDSQTSTRRRRKPSRPLSTTMMTSKDPVRRELSDSGSTHLESRVCSSTTSMRMSVTAWSSARSSTESTTRSSSGTELKRSQTMSSRRESTARLHTTLLRS